MVVGIKDSAKLVGISIVSCCAVLVCTMFLNFYFDVLSIKNEITSELSMAFYNAQVSTAKVVCMVSGGCLLITSVIMLLFYIKHYIDIHKKELGILKALGYSNLKIAKNFWVFGISVFIGTAPGFGGAFLLMPSFYELQNEDKILPEMAIHFHPSILFYFVVLPTVAFAVIAIFYACYKLKKPVLSLLKNDFNPVPKGEKRRDAARSFDSSNTALPDRFQAVSDKTQKCKAEKSGNRSFIADLKKNTLKSKKSLVFFIIFASFCFSAMTQMSASMKDLSSEMMGAMVMLIGLVLAFTTLFLAITTVINSNKKTIAMMRVFGYSHKQCCTAILGGYRPLSYLGFAIGTGYQYALLRIMVDIVFKDIEGVPVYEFDFPMMLVSLAVFIIIYEIVMYVYSEKIKKISIKEIMLE